MPRLDLREVETRLRLGDPTYFTASILSHRRAETHWLCERLWNATGPGQWELKPDECIGITRMRISHDYCRTLWRLAPCHVGHYMYQRNDRHACVGRHLIVLQKPELHLSLQNVPIVVPQGYTVTINYSGFSPTTFNGVLPTYTHNGVLPTYTLTKTRTP